MTAPTVTYISFYLQETKKASLEEKENCCMGNKNLHSCASPVHLSSMARQNAGHNKTTHKILSNTWTNREKHDYGGCGCHTDTKPVPKSAPGPLIDEPPAKKSKLMRMSPVTIVTDSDCKQIKTLGTVMECTL